MGAHAGWFCPGHQHAPALEIVSVDESVSFGEDDDPCTQSRRQLEPGELAALGKQVRRVAETHTVPKELVTAIANDPSLLGQFARAEVVLRNGQPIGFRISGTTRGGIVRQLGLRDGDIVTNVAGRPMKSLDEVSRAASAVRGLAQVRVLIERDGVEIRKRYLVR